MRRITVEHIAWMPQFHFTKCLNTCNTIAQRHQRSEKVAVQASLLVSAAEAPFIRKTTMFRANPTTQIAPMIRENEAFVRGLLQLPKVEGVKTKLSCDASVKFQKLKMWKRSFRARLHSNSNTWRCQIEAFARGFLQIPTVEDVKSKLSRAGSFKFQQLKIWTQVFNAAVPLHKVSQHLQHDSTAKHHQRRETVTWHRQFHRARNWINTRDDARNRRPSEPTRLRSGSFVYPKKHNVSCKS